MVCKGTFDSDTKDVEQHVLQANINILNEQNGEMERKQFCLTIYDTPGFHDTRSKETNMLTNKKIAWTLKEILDKDERKLNFLAFIARAGDMQFEDKNIFRSIMEGFKCDLSSNTMLILTHCDNIDPEKLKEYLENLKNHEQTKHIVEYCKLGIYPFGVLDETTLRANVFIPGIPDDIRNKIINYKINRQKQWRQELLEGMYRSKDMAQDVRAILSLSEEVYGLAKRRCLIS